MSLLKFERCHRSSGYFPRSEKAIPAIGGGKYWQDSDVSISGAAPKGFIRIYEYGAARRNKRYEWQGYIAKVGHKWYPNESITEQLLTRVGQELGFTLADSRLLRIRGQVRFLSRYFLRRGKDELVHGAEVFGFYLEDEEFVKQAEAERLDRELLTLQVARNALEARFPHADQHKVFGALLEMLVFDAIVGNNDRHHMNWGVIRDITGKRPIEFAPIYDTARGLFWNAPDSHLTQVCSSESSRRHYLNQYIERSTCKMGWDGADKFTHFELVKHIRDAYPAFVPQLVQVSDASRIERIEEVVNEEFASLMTPLRRDLIIDCLKIRLEKVEAILR